MKKNQQNLFNEDGVSPEQPPFESDEHSQSPQESELPTSFDELINKELVKFDVVIPAVEELKEKYMPLKIASIDDEEGYKEVAASLKFIVSKRTAVEDKRKELKADSLKFGRAVDARAKEITAMLEPIETHLKSEKERIDAEKERIKKEEEERVQKKINDRITQLVSLGMYQTMTEFVWASKITGEEINFVRVNLEIFSDEQFDEFVQNLTKIVNTEKAELDAIEEKKKAEEKALEEERELLRKEQEQLEEEKRKLQKELNDIREARVLARNTVLTNLGLGTLSFSPFWVYISSATSRPIDIVHHDEVANLGLEEWNLKLEEIKSRVQELKQKDEEAEREKREKEDKERQKAELSLTRSAVLVELGLKKSPTLWFYSSKFDEKTTDIITIEEVATLESGAWDDKLESIKETISGLVNQDEKNISEKQKREQEEREQELKKQEEERLAAMSDKDIFNEYITKLAEVPLPQLKTKKWQGYLNTLSKTLDSLKTMG